MQGRTPRNTGHPGGTACNPEYDLASEYRPLGPGNGITQLPGGTRTGDSVLVRYGIRRQPLFRSPGIGRGRGPTLVLDK